MTTSSSGPITRLLATVNQGDLSAREELWSLVYDELLRLARSRGRDLALGGVRQPTSLVHEAYIRLTANENVEWVNRKHFFAAAAQAMRRIQIDYARKRDSQKRGGDQRRQSLDDNAVAFDQDPAEALAIDEALNKLERENPQQAEVVNLRYFAGLTIDETAAALGLAPRTVDKRWHLARAWLHRELSDP